MEKLKQVLAQDDTVLFVGSGISLWSGLPTWGGIIEELAKFVELSGAKADLVRAEANKGDLLQAASYGFDKLTKQQIGDFIRKTCRWGSAKPSEIHRKIVLLGPRCFVTTNYDNLIEESLRTWQPDRFFRPPITNRHLTETAEVVHARSIDFIFKPHGDAADSDSIILTREQYRQLLPGGERQAALESLKMLLASRPVVYLGFGLRDPDFIYVRDLLANTYKGGVRDHYAIMADVSDAECDYWRRNYGIHFVSYETQERSDGTRDHTAILTLLDTLLNESSANQSANEFYSDSPEVVLALARYAAGLARHEKLDREFKIRVNAMHKPHSGHYVFYDFNKFDHLPVEKFLDEGPERAVLIGLPGAGKTYSLYRSAARLAEKLHGSCLSDGFDGKSVIIPIIADLKLYKGDLGVLISNTLPKYLPFDELTKHFKVKIFLDSFNEMPREYWESGCYESDFIKFIDRIGSSSLIIGSRTNDGLGKLELSAYCLDQLDESTVMTELQRLGFEIEGRFINEVKSLLQRPFYFQYILNGTVNIPKEAHPRDFYRGYFEHLQLAFLARFNQSLDIENTLSIAAYNALNLGEEAFPLADLLHVLKNCLDSFSTANVDILDIANWLVSSSVLIPHTSGRVAFIHQSVTEYLAGTELARLYLSNPHILKEKLCLTRWDQALFLTVSLLPAEHADIFFQEVIEADFILALNAAKYIEVGRDELISKLLKQIAMREDSEERNWNIDFILKYGLPITNTHEPQLRELIKCGNTLGSAAACRLVELKGAIVKDELLQLLVDRSYDFNFCTGIGQSLQQFATDEDVQKIAAWADSMEDEFTSEAEQDELQGFISGAAEFLSEISLSVIRREFLGADKTAKIPEVRARILANILQSHHSTEALNCACELLERGVKSAAVTIYFILEHARSNHELSWASFEIAHVNLLLSRMEDASDIWVLDALRSICSGRQDLAELVRQIAHIKTGIQQAALLYCLSPTDLAPVFQALAELTNTSADKRLEQPIHTLQRVKLDWSGKEDLFVQLLKLRDRNLMSALFGGSCPPSLEKLGTLDIGSIGWCLEWISEESCLDNDCWFVTQLGALLGAHLKLEVQQQFIAEFNNPESKYRHFLLHNIMPFFKEITADSFSEDTMSFMLADLNTRAGVQSLYGYFLGNIATEHFVTERLLPLLACAKQPLLNNLHQVLKQAGSRHGKRYLLG